MCNIISIVIYKYFFKKSQLLDFIIIICTKIRTLKLKKKLKTIRLEKMN